MARWNGKVVWITGGGSGIGRAVAEQMAREGASVAISGRREDRLQEVAQAIESDGGIAAAVAVDVTDEAAVEAAAAAVVDRFGGLDVALANAGFAVGGRIEKLTADEWRRQLDVNVVGAAMTAKYAIPHLKARRGRLGLVGSVAGYVCAPKNGAYNASKFAVRALGQTLSVELHGSGVTCTTVHPGFVESEIAQVDNEGVFDGSRPDKRPQRLMWPTDKAARVVVDALHRRKRELVFTGHGKIGAFLGQHAPGLAVTLMGRAAGKR